MPDLFESTLTPASYEGVRFPVGDCHTDGGHDAAEHAKLRGRGISAEPTGQQPYRGTMEVPLVQGLRSYPNAFTATYFDLIRAFESTPIGRLTHPTKGSLTALIKNWPERLVTGNRSGAVLTVHWVEHNATAGILLGQDGDPARDASTAAAKQAAAADGAMAAADPTGSFSPLSLTFTNQLAALDSGLQTTALVSSAINLMLAPIESNLALAAFASASAYPAVAALVLLRATTYRMRDRFLGGSSRIRRVRLERDTSALQVAHQVLGDASLVGMILDANPIAMRDPTRIPAGTVLVIPAA